MRPGKRTALRHLLELQRCVFAAATKEGVEARDLAQLARAWDCLEDRKRILRNRPLPGSLKPERAKRRTYSSNQPLFSETET
jgi:hypothetical protein